VHAITFESPGDADVLTWAEVPDPRIGAGEVLIKTAATAVNRADILQRRGYYNPPPGASDILGLECSGTIVEIGEDVTEWSVGDEVCALLAGGGYAERVVVDAGSLLPIPAGIDITTAGGLPEVACTTWSNLFMVAALRPTEVLLIHGGSSGIGTFAIQLAKQAGARVAVTCGTPEKAKACVALGADFAINYHDEDFVERINEWTDGAGADVILDNMGAKYLARNVAALATNGRLVIIGMQGGVKAELDINALMYKRGAIIGTTIRSRPLDEKAAIAASVREHVWPLLAEGAIKPVVDRSFPIEDAADAHRYLEGSSHIGKVLLTVDKSAR
jgi:putative PIG3 family NAD(P)H quinone oxidoreductase